MHTFPPPLSGKGIVFFVATDLNPIYDAIIALMAGGLATGYCRPDLRRKMGVSAVLFPCFYFLYFITLNAAVPGYVLRVWNLGAIGGVLILGVSLEELFFTFSFGFYWSKLYEHFTRKEVPEKFIPGY